MTNEMFYELLKEMKRQGKSYKWLAEKVNIPVLTLYDNMNDRRFTDKTKNAIIDYLREYHKEMYETIMCRIKCAENEK